MVRWGARLVLFFAFLLLISSLAFSAESFSGCFEAQKLGRFWFYPSFSENNPAILDIFIAQFYSFGFDNSTQSLGFSNLELCDKLCLDQRLSPSELQELSTVSSSLSPLHESISLAKKESASAHLLSLKGQTAVRTLSDPLAYAGILSPYPQLSPEKIRFLLAIPDFSNYVISYPEVFGQSLLNSVDAYESINTALAALASKADEKYAFLSRAGAGSPQYSGKAKGAFLHAKSLISAGAFCTSSRASVISDYFNSPPNMPDFSGIGFGGYLQYAGGTQDSSSFLELLSAFRQLRDAASGMEDECDSSLRSAQTAINSLQSSIHVLQAEHLEMINEVQAQGSQQIAVGSSFSGIYGGLKEGQLRLEEAQAMLSEAKRLKGSTHQEGYLADSISSAQSAVQLSQTATSSLADVRSNAEAAVLAEKHLAEKAISAAEEKVQPVSSSFSDMRSISAAGQKLSDAKNAYESAAGLQTLGEKFSAYKNARALASAAASAIEGRASYLLQDDASKEISTLKLLVSQAGSDGLDVSYEREKVSEYESMLRTAESAEVFLSLSRSAADDRQALSLRLYEKYFYLEAQYSQTKELVSAIRETQPSFLKPQFDSLEKDFAFGKLDVSSAAGSLKGISQALSDAQKKADEELPSYFSLILTRNARVHEFSDPPILGKAGKYHATIATANPTSFSYAGAVSFSAPTAIAIYSSDYTGGDALSDAFYEKGKTNVLLNSIKARQVLSFSFERTDQPAQITSSSDVCTVASESGASFHRTTGFFASRALPELGIFEAAPEGAQNAKASYAGAFYPLLPTYAANNYALAGLLQNIKQGANTLEISYSLPQPFTISQSTRLYQTISPGTKKVSYELEVSGAKASCGSATVSLDEPFGGVSEFSVVSLGAEKMLQQKAVATTAGTHAYFSFSPLATGSMARFSVSFTLQNESQALLEAIESAELQVLRYNRTRDISALAEAKLLSQQNRNDEALSILAKMQQEARLLPYTEIDRQNYLVENAGAQALLESARAAQDFLTMSNSTQASSALSALSQKLSIALASADDVAQSEEYSKALSAIRKAESDFSSSLSQLAWSSASEAMESYAKAAKLFPGASSEKLRMAQEGVAEANRLYSQGDALGSYLASANAKSRISALLSDAAGVDTEAIAEAEAIRTAYSSLRNEIEPLLATYSSQYSSLSGASKKQLPFTPSDAQKRLDDADKALAASAKNTLSASEQLAAANSSYQKLRLLQDSLKSALSSLQQSASSSLLVAKAALAEVKAKSSQDNPEALQIESEVGKADNFLANSLYADSLMSSDRAIAAASIFLSKNASTGIDAKTILLAAVSLLFLAGAVWFFLKGGKKAEPKEKKSLPKEE